MTENEAKNILLKEVRCLERATKEICDTDCEKCSLLNEAEEKEDALYKAMKALEEIQAYRAIGTIEEFKALKEKNEPKKVVIEHTPKTSWTKEVSRYKCTCCDAIISFSGTNYCSVCGQKLDWSE